MYIYTYIVIKKYYITYKTTIHFLYTQTINYIYIYFNLKYFSNFYNVRIILKTCTINIYIYIYYKHNCISLSANMSLF